MATFTKIVKSKSVRINTGQYEGTEVFTSMEVTLDELDVPADEEAKLEATLDQSVLASVMRVHKARGKKPTVQAIAIQHGLHIPETFRE